VGLVGRLRTREEDERERQFEQIAGNSRALEFVISEVERVPPTDSTVLIVGETRVCLESKKGSKLPMGVRVMNHSQS
jgi:transcriptional regulator of aromatic amino acid metabolism